MSRDGLVGKQIHELVTLLLQRLLDEIPDIDWVRLMVEPGSGAGPTADGEITYAGIERTRAQQLPELSFTDPLSDGGQVTLVMGITAFTEAATESMHEAARRYLIPVVTSLELNQSVDRQRTRAQSAVDAVERTALLDLATGVVMARQRVSSRSARAAIAAWSDRTGTQIGNLTASSMLDLLTGDEL